VATLRAGVVAVSAFMAFFMNDAAAAAATTAATATFGVDEVLKGSCNVESFLFGSQLCTLSAHLFMN